jgi:hypothetical protein
MPWVGFEPSIPAFERSEALHALDCAATVIGQSRVYVYKTKSNVLYRMFSAQADWTLTHMSHKDTEQSTTEASITFDGVTLTDILII